MVAYDSAVARPGVVFGVPRSGTTFLMNFLGALPDAECVTGNLLPIGLIHLAAQDLPKNVRQILERSFRGSLREYVTTGAYHSRSAALRKWWITGHPLAGLHSALRGIRTESFLVYKEPFLAFAPEFAYDALADSRIIYIFRDGRDVADSLIRTYDILTDQKLSNLETNEAMMGTQTAELYVPWWVSEADADAFLQASPYIRALWMWRVMIRRCQEFLQRGDVVASGRVLAIRYEDLMRDPIGLGSAVVEHIGARMTPRVRRRLETAHSRSIGIYGRLQAELRREADRLVSTELAELGY